MNTDQIKRIIIMSLVSGLVLIFCAFLNLTPKKDTLKNNPQEIKQQASCRLRLSRFIDFSNTP